MKILIVGGGGREHAIAWKLAKSPKVGEIYCAPGNAGIAEIAQCVDIKAEDIDGICRFAKDKGIDLAVIGPEVALSMGIVDELTEIGVKAFGPNKKCAQLESSKSFTKAFLARHSIPTAGYREFTDIEQLKACVGIFGYPMVIKADGLAAGKGVVIAEDEAAAIAAIDQIMGERIFGTAGDKIVVEEFLSGIEASVLCFVDGNTIVPMESAQDYKRIFDGDKGPNTGGMGTYSPSLIFNERLERQIREQILEPTIKGFQKDGLNFKGILFIGLMITKEGPKVIEFNNRFGDPETQSVLPRLKTDLLDIMNAVIEEKLAEQIIEWSDTKAVCVILASGGYPGSYEKGKIISGLNDLDEDVIVFHSGTKLIKGHEVPGPSESDESSFIATDGGRVLGITALGKTHEEARKKAYKNAAGIYFEGVQYRKDIGLLNIKTAK
ncbi:MAG: phosphoribosylamine--glycine ligase [Eubacteriales bacterium]|nr:phosphoribosylamine--glycine ligase [Eubacteriales bacterium]MDD3199365.1 phosphoribosylamine--glycine ligase [Eubacteriales bacterium]MDD4122260.1 phosphoribosylamine--glycine ligase [Eubacteriales bacterium]MDD4629217.1 phosphoribosylamine--glycine ligase [Eubacteriales bacterium]